MPARTRLQLIGGFLGAGKTTLINRLAQGYADEGRRVGVVTNDQGRFLIDTEFAKLHGFNVEEVTGSCFCCNFPKLFENLEKLSGEGGAEYILAEPVGSCTDLVATLMMPLRMYHADRFSVAPLIVMVDGARMFDGVLDAVTLGGYLRHHQVAEAEYIVLSKTDLLGPEDVDRFMTELRGINPTAKVIRYSAVTDEGFDEIVDIIDGTEETSRRPVDVDYARYADAEAELGWYNGVFEFDAEDTDACDLASSLLRDIGSKYPASSVAHAKVAFTWDGGHVKVSLIGGDVSVGGMYGSGTLNGKTQMNLNARIASDPGALREAVSGSVGKVLGENGIHTFGRTFEECFAPGKPNPTYRMA